MLLAAAEPLGDAALVWRAAEQARDRAGALAPAEAAGLLEIGERVRFRHPLVRSAVYRAAPLGDRQRVHEALAEVSDPELDADRRAWHRRAAATAPTRTSPPSSSDRPAERRPRRARRRSGVPAPRRRADAGPGAARGTCAGGRAGQRPGRRVRRGPRAAGHGRGRAARRAPARADGPAARPARVRLQPRHRRDTAAAGRRPAARAAGPPARARDLHRAFSRGDVRRAAAAGAAPRSAAAAGRCPARGCAAHRDLLLDGAGPPAPTDARPRLPLLREVAERSGDDLGRGDACGGAGSPRRPRRSGTTNRHASVARQVQIARDTGTLASCRST